MTPNQPDSDKLDDNFVENVLEIYDESIQRDESVTWLIAEADLALLDNPPERPTRFTTPQDTERIGPQHLRPPVDRPIFSFPAAPFSARLADGSSAHPNPTRRFLRVAAVVAILLIGSALPSIIERRHPARVKASPALGTPLAAYKKNANVRILTVMTSHQETIRDICVRYTRHFDVELMREIRSLNPGWTDSDNFEDGQIIRIPMRPKLELQDSK